jgi:hypothetical protein
MSKVNHSDRKHSEIGASSAHRWLNCPGSVAATRGLPDKTSSYASEGTCAHEASEYCFANDCDASETIGMKFEGHTVDEEMASHVQYYLDNMKKYTDSEEYDVFIEEKFELPNIHKDMFGSNDFCAMGIENGELVIADFKYGKGLNVSAKENIQLIIYALGAYHDSNEIYGFERVKLIVVQPRIEGSEWDEWEISVEELLEYQEKLKEGVKEVYSDKPKLSPGDHCRFCKAKPTCKALLKKTEELTTHAFDSVPIEKEPTFPKPQEMDKETIAKILTHSSLIEDWMKSVSAYAHTLMDKGEEIPGFKLVSKRSNRKFRDEKAIIDQFEPTFGDKIFRTQLQTLGNLEKLVGKKELEPFLYKPDTGNQIAPLADKRPSVAPACLIDDAFDDADKDEQDFDNMEF